MEWRFEGRDGVVTVAQEGSSALCRASRPMDGGLWKAWLLGGGGRVLLGTLIPEGDCLRLRRTIPLAQLVRQGVWPPEGAELCPRTQEGRQRPVPEGWRRCDGPPAAVTDPLLRSCLAGQPSILYRQERGGFSLALPLSDRRPFPLTPLFCLAAVEVLEGEQVARFFFDETGHPRLSVKE